MNLVAVVVAGPQVNLFWSAAAITGETGFSIERRNVTANQAFAQLDTVGPDIESYVGDTGPFTPQHRYQYRIVVLGGPSAGVTSNLVTVFGGAVPYIRRRRHD